MNVELRLKFLKEGKAYPQMGAEPKVNAITIHRILHMVTKIRSHKEMKLVMPKKM